MNDKKKMKGKENLAKTKNIKKIWKENEKEGFWETFVVGVMNTTNEGGRQQ